MSELTLEDLAGAGDEAADAQAVEEAAESGESLLDMVEFLDDKGYLGPLVFGEEFETADMETVEETGSGGGPALTAENIAGFGDTITEQIGDVPLSTVIEYCENNPEEVNRVIKSSV